MGGYVGKWISIAKHPDQAPAHILERFWAKVEKTATPAGCWLWKGKPDRLSGGYGKFGYYGRSEAAHRISYALAHGAITPEWYVCHKCDVPLCVAPHHLYLGTALDNMRDKYERGRAHTTRLYDSSVFLRVNEIGKERGLSAKDVARLSGVPFGTVIGIWRNQIVYVELGVLGKIADALGVGPGDLLRKVA